MIGNNVTKRPTIKQIAQEASVSPTLVSFYLNGRQPNKIAQKTKEKIAATIERLDYRPSAAARTLRNGRSRTIGLMIGQIAGEYSSFYAQSLLYEVLKYGYQLLISVTRFNLEEERKCLENLLDHQADGILYHLFLKPTPKMLPALKHYPILQRTSVNPDFNSLIPGIAPSILQAVQQCRKQGIKKIAGICLGTGPENSWRAGFIAGAEAAGIESVCLDGDYSSFAELYEALRETGAELAITGSSTTVARLLHYRETTRRTDCPKFIYSYTLPCDYISHEAIAGVIVNSFEDEVCDSIKRLIAMIEKGPEPVEHLTTPTRFLNREELSAYYRKQKANPYYDTVVNEREIKRIWD